ncbi:MAG: ABC transporter permease [Pseudomonadota bacterium]
MFDLQGYGPLLLIGTLTTVAVALSALVIATLLGMATALAKLSGGRVGGAIAGVYTTVIRGVPDLVLMLIIFYGGQLLVNDAAQALGYDGYVDVSPFAAGILTIGFIFGAYMGETFRGAILAVPAGQTEAGTAYGMSPRQVLWRVTLPQMLRHALPGFGNNWLVLLKTTALVSVIGLDDMMRKAALAAGATREPFTFYLAAAVLYLVLTSLSIAVLRWAERRADVGHV